MSGPPLNHRVLSIPELLYNIFSFMSKNENKTNARVCKQWSEIALDFIWKEVDSLPQLLNLLRLYHDDEDDTYFIEHINPEDWERFQKYAARVRTLRYHRGRDNFYTLFDDMARTRLGFEMLPNLQTLEWYSQDEWCMGRAMVFMHQHVRYFIFKLDIYSVGCHKMHLFFANTCARMPHLHLLDLRLSFGVRSIERYMMGFLQGLPDLKTVIFPEFYLTSDIVSELSRMKHIRCIRFESGDEQGRGVQEDVRSFAPFLEQGAFPVLQTLYITARLEDAAQFMGADFAPTNLTSLFINNYIESEPNGLRTLLLTLSDKCHLLSALRILLLHTHVDKELELIPENQITFHTLEPVLSFQNLTLFEISHKYPVNITLEEIEELASRWPSLESLSLNEAPLFMLDAAFDMRALLPFALHCPKLRHLGIFMNTSTVKTHQIHNSWKPFAVLRSLSVGSSQLDVSNFGSVTTLLSHLCPPECILKAESYWLTSPSCALLSHELLRDIHDRIARWSHIVLILPPLIRNWRSILHEEREGAQRSKMAC